MWFGKTVRDFNRVVANQKGPDVIADIGNAFTSESFSCMSRRRVLTARPVIYVAYAFYAVPVVSSLTKVNVKLGKA